MAGRLRSAVLFASTSAVLLLAASASPPPSPRPPAVYVVGDEMGWAVPPAGATGALNEWAARHRFVVGDVLLFRYPGGGDAALLVPRDGYERCSSASPPSPFAGGGSVVGVFGIFTLGCPGPHYFISGTPARCEAGERMAVFVEDPRTSRRSSGAPTPAPAPDPGTAQPPDTPPPPPSGHRRLSLAQQEFAAAAIGFGAGFVLIFFILWLCVCFNS